MKSIMQWCIFLSIVFMSCGCSFFGSIFDSIASDSISDSSESVSKSVATASRSISRSLTNSSRSSSDSEESETVEKESYRKEVREYTVVFMESGSTSTSFKRDISQIAKDHGISDWEQNKDTYLAIGEGLKQAGISTSDMIRLKHRFAGSPRALKYLMQGYENFSS